MMEESSDESAEIVDKEEALKAEQQYVTATSQAPGAMSTSVAPPAPLPAFMLQSGTPETPAKTSTPVSPTSSGPTAPLRTGSLSPPGPVAGSPVSPPGSVAQLPAVSPASSGVLPPTTATMTPIQTSAMGDVPQTLAMSSSGSPTIQPHASQVQPPGPQQSPYEASSAIDYVPEMEVEQGTSQSPQGSGLFGWFSGNKMLNKVMEKTKSSMESMITTLDPGMKEVIRSGGDICLVVTSDKESKVGAVREAFQQTFGRASVIGQATQATTAAQPVGFTVGLKGAQERIQNLRKTENIPDSQPIVSMEGFIVEMLPDRWYEMSCLVLQDPEHRIDLQTFSQPSPIPAHYILKAQDRTPADYNLRWSGLAVTIGQIVEEEQPHIGHADWQGGIVGVSRRESLFLAAKSLAYMYKQRLPATFV